MRFLLRIASFVHRCALAPASEQSSFIGRWTGGFVLLAGLVGLGVGPAAAQQPESPTLLRQLEQSEHVDQVPMGVLQSVYRQSPKELTADQRRRVREFRVQQGHPRTKTTLDLDVLRSQQQSFSSPWPRSDLNFRPGKVAVPAGDVNGDGVNDWIYRYFSVADDRTSDLSDRTSKTLLAFGGEDFTSRYYDELYYGDFTPVGNFVGNDHADAVKLIDSGIQIYRGADVGYQEAAVNTDVQGIPDVVADLDGDGYDDVISTSGSDPAITVLFGAQDPANVTEKTFSPSFEDKPLFSYAADDIDGDGSGEIVRVSGENQTSQEAPEDRLIVDVFALAGDESALIEDQEIILSPDFQVFASSIRPNLANIDGSGLKEILLKTSPTLVLTSSSGSYEASPIEYTAGNGDLNHVGDLNEDGRADFFFAEGGDAGIGFGPEDVGSGLSLDLVFDEEETPVFVPFPFLSPAPFGDLTGDGRDDLIAQVNPSEQFGSQLVQVSDAGTFESRTDFLFDDASYDANGVQQTVNVGDWDGDGTDDVGFVLTDGRVEIYYGDPTQSISPDLTLTGPQFDSFGGVTESAVAAGDFTGDGDPNLAVAWQSDTRTVAVYEAGMGDSPIHTIGIEDLGISPDAEGIDDVEEDGPNSVVANLGDINGDGIDDLGVTEPEVETPAALNVFLFFGASSLSTTPDVTVDYSNRGVGRFFGQVLRGVGDFNGDGTDDFLVGDTDTQFDGGEDFPDDPFGNGFLGALFVHYGDAGASPSFDTSDEILAVPSVEFLESGEGRTNAFFGFQGVAVGDFNADDTTDIAAKPAISSFFTQVGGATAIRVFHGGENIDGAPDAARFVPGFLDRFGDTQYADGNFGGVTKLPAATAEGPDRLMIETQSRVNALLYGPGPDTSYTLEQTTLLRGPDQGSGLGEGSNIINFPQNPSSATGDFNGNGQTNLVMPQLQSDDFRGKPAYTYELGTDPEGEEEEPVASSTESIDGENQAGSRVEFGGTGTAVVFSDSASGSGDVTVERYDSAPEGAAGISGNASEYRVTITAGGDLSVGDSTEVRFDVSQLEGIDNPSAVTIYVRTFTGIGEFEALNTTYDDGEDELFALVSDFSEFAFGSQSEPLFSYPEQVTADASRTFGDASGPGDYRLVALPGAVDRDLSESLPGEVGIEWQAYWDDGSDFVRYDDSDTFRFQAGNGFWVTSKQEWSVSDTVQTVALSENQTASLSLNGESEWTIVSNPFDRDVLWRDVLGESGLDVPLWRYDSDEGFVQPDTMRSAASGTAYYVLNDAGVSELTIPYPAIGNEKSAPKARESVSLLALSARPASESGPASTVKVGLGEKTAHVAPPGRFEPVSLRLSASDGEQPLMVARRPAQDGGQTFALDVTRRVEGPVELSAENLDAIEGQSVALLHPSAGTTYDLREESSVQIEPEGKATELKVAIGTKNYVEGKAGEVVPEEVSLTSYPNPVRQQGTVEYALPEETDVTLRVYDVLGRQVATLEAGRKKAGRHTVRLETDQLASGVYFGRLQAGGRTLTKKITVVR